MKRYKAHIIESTPEAKQFVKDYLKTLSPEQKEIVLQKLDDSIERCPQIGKKCAFIDPDMTGNKVKNLLQLCNVIQFGRTFLYDTGTEALPITLENYKSIPYLEWLTESPYTESEI